MARDTGLLGSKAALTRWAPWIAVAVLVAGAVSFAVARYTGGDATSKSTASTIGSAPVHRRAPFTADERRVALDFVHTAVARRNLAHAWTLAAPELVRGMTLDEWKTGTIPVVPYPVAEATPLLHVISSFADVAQLEVSFVPHPGSHAAAAKFRLGLESVDGRWLVSSWLPDSTIAPPGK